MISSIEVTWITTGIFCFFELLLGIKFLVIKKADFTFHSSEVARAAALATIKHEALVLLVAFGMVQLIIKIIQS